MCAILQTPNEGGDDFGDAKKSIRTVAKSGKLFRRPQIVKTVMQEAFKMKSVKKGIAIVLMILTACSVLSPAASAKAIDRKGISSDPSVTTFNRLGDAYYYNMEIQTGDTITLRLVDSSGKPVKVPKDGRVVWTADPYPTGASDAGKVKLTPSADGSTCTLKAVKGGRDVSVIATIYDRNDKEINWYLCFVQPRYTTPEWIAFYLTLGYYGINWKNLLEFDGFEMFLLNLVTVPGILILTPFSLVHPEDQFHSYN